MAIPAERIDARKLARRLVLLLTVWVLPGCDPSANAVSMPVIVRTVADGILVEVPVCAPNDSVRAVDVAGKGWSLELRSTSDSTGGTGAKWIELDVTMVDLTSGRLGSILFKIVSRLGNPTSVHGATLFVNTSRGHAELFLDAFTVAGTDYIINGESPPVPIVWPAAQIAAQWCSGKG